MEQKEPALHLTAPSQSMIQAGYILSKTPSQLEHRIADEEELHL